MKQIIRTFLFVCTVCLMHAQQTEKFRISVNKNIELLGLAYTVIYENVENSLFDTTDENWQFGQFILKEYGRFGESESLQSILPSIAHLWISDFTYLLTNIADFPNATLAPDIDYNRLVQFSKSRNKEEALQNVKKFLDVMNAFYKEVKFDTYLANTQIYYRAAISEVKESIGNGDFIPVIEKIYQNEFDQYYVVPSLSLPPSMGFATHNEDTACTIFSALGTQDLSKKQLGFKYPDLLRDKCVHEFGHSLLKPTFHQLPPDLITDTQHLFLPIKETMGKQNYLSWPAILDEHIVRTGEILTARILKNPDSEKRLQKKHMEQKRFIYLPVFIDKLYNGYIRDKNYLNTLIKVLKELKTPSPVSKKNNLKKNSVKGFVRDAKTKEPIPFVNIGFFGKNLGTISREDGSFKINTKGLEPTDSLTFSSIGYQSYSIPLNSIKTESFVVEMKEEIFTLNEVTVTDDEIIRLEKFGRTKATKTTTGESNSTQYGYGGEHGIKLNGEKQRFLLQDVNFHMRFNTTDSILFRINIYNVVNELPHQPVLRENLFIKSYKRQKWITKDFSDKKIVIDDEVIVTLEVVKIWYSDRTNNNIFITWGKGEEKTNRYRRASSLDRWDRDTEQAIPIALYVTGRLF